MSNRRPIEVAAITTLRQAQEIAGTLGNPSKMPGKSYGLPAASAPWVPAACLEMGMPVPAQWGCPVGALLANVKGTTCSACYANNRGNYQYSSVRKAQAKRASGVYHPQWVDAIVFLIERKVDRGDAFFRWHDSGDLLGRWHLERIVDVAKRTPWVQHWLPTRESAVIADYVASGGRIPKNLMVRVSATKVDRKPPKAHRYTSTVHKVDAPVGYSCPALTQGNACRDCRACWSRKVRNVSYHVH